MKKILVLLLAGAVFIGGYALYSRYNPSQTSPQEEGVSEFIVPSMGERYTNDTYRFFLQMPEGFTVREMPTAPGVTVVLEDAQANGIQIVITPVDEDIPALTKERIEADIPDLTVREQQPLQIGEGRTGLAFKSDNPAFGGASREVWFVFDKNLYQISTYERLDPLLQAVFQTWTFF